MGVVRVGIMAHPKRREWAEQLSTALDAQIVWDRRNDRIDTGHRVIDAHRDHPDATHWLVVQDDAIICRDLIPALNIAVDQHPDRLIGLYVGRGLNISTFRLRQLARRADDQHAAWLHYQGCLWGPAIVYPVDRIPELLRSYARDPLGNYDARVQQSAKKRGVGWLHTWPSLVDHRTDEGSPSLVEGRTNVDRSAYRFIGADRSALDVDWTRPVARE